MGFLSNVFQGEANKESMLAQSVQARVNAHVADNAAADALQRGEQKVAQVQAAGSQRQAEQKVAYAHAGVDTSSGTPATMISQTAMITQLESLTQRNNAARQAYGYKVQATQLRLQADDLEHGAETAFNMGSAAAGVGSVAWMVSMGGGG